MIREEFQEILDHYADTPPGTPWGEGNPVYRTLKELAGNLKARAAAHPYLTTSIAGRGRKSLLAYLALLDSRVTPTVQRGVYAVYLFREDLSSFYLTLAIGVTEPARDFRTDLAGYRNYLRAEVRKLRPYADDLQAKGFAVDGKIDLGTADARGQAYELGTVAYKMYERGNVPSDEVLEADLEALLKTYEKYVVDLGTTGAPDFIEDGFLELQPQALTEVPFDPKEAVTGLCEYIANRGFVFENWQVAAYVAALRTKPFVILAGVTGTGKSTLPRLVADATGGTHRTIPVRPDWTDSSDVLGYVDLAGTFKPGPVLNSARQAIEAPSLYLTCILDEMNLARVEQYFAEALSRIEDRRPAANGGFESPPLPAFIYHKGWRKG